MPATPSVVPFDLVPTGDTALELRNKPLDLELENVIEDPPFDEWHVRACTVHCIVHCIVHYIVHYIEDPPCDEWHVRTYIYA